MARERVRLAKAEQKRTIAIAEQKPILDDLAAIGIQTSSLGQMLNSEKIDARSIPILLKHLTCEYSDATRATLARCLAIKEAAYVWDFLVDAYKNEPLISGTRESQTKDGLAVALAVTMTSDKLEELISLLYDKSMGPSRVLLLMPLRRKRKNSSVILALRRLVMDPELEKEIKAWKVEL